MFQEILITKPVYLAPLIEKTTTSPNLMLGKPTQ